VNAGTKQLLANGIDPSVIKKAERLKRARIQDKQARQKTAARFMLDSNGALSFRLGNRHLILTSAETIELRTFLEATQEATPRPSPTLTTKGPKGDFWVSIFV
jgi:hypothetical protein